MRRATLRRILGTSACLVLCIATSASAVTTYGGRAYGALVDAPILPDLYLADTGSLPSTGGALSAFVLNVNGALVSQSISSTTMNCQTTAGSEVSNSFAQTEGLQLGLQAGAATASITAEVLRANAGAVCMGTSGSSLITNLRINNQGVTVTGQPNQVVGIPGVATVIINEQISSVGSGGASMTTNALHVILLGEVAAVVVSHAEASVSNCSALAVPNATWGATKALFR
jgi:hypothetical protein